MEAVERTSALWSNDWFVATESGARERVGIAWGPAAFTERPSLDVQRPLAWTVARDLVDGRPVAVPADLVFVGQRPREAPDSALDVRTSNGLAAGMTSDEALIRALLESIERDVVSMYELRCGHYALGAIAAVCRLLGLDEAAVLAPYREDADLATTIDPHEAPDPLPEIAQRFDEAGLAVTMKLLTNEFGLPIFGAAAVDHLGFDSISATAGYGIDGDPVMAAVAALLELAQSRATDRQGAREDCGVEEKGRLASVPDGHWLLQPGRIAGWTESVGAATTVSAAELVRRLQRSGLQRAAAVDLPAPVGLAAVRVVVPEAETWHATAGHSRLGVRARSALGLAGDYT